MNDSNPEQFEVCSCAWCGSSEFTIEFTGPDRLEKFPGKFQFVRCAACGLFRQNPRLTWSFLKKFYPVNYKSYSYIDKTEESKFNRYFRQHGNWKKSKLVKSFIKGGRILEVGCGTGEFLDELLRSGQWNAMGIEPNDHAASQAEARLGIPVYRERIDQFEFENNLFDAVIMWYVLEHLEQPIKSIQKIYMMLKEGGFFFFSMPLVDGWESNLFGKYWSGWDLPRHLYIFPLKLMRQILRDIGFQIVSEKCISSGHAILGHSIEFWTQPWENKYPQIKKWLMKLYLSPIGKTSLMVPLYFSDKLNKSTTYTIVAKKTRHQ